MQSMFSHMLHEQSTGVRILKKLKFVWIQRDPELMIQSQMATVSTSLHGSKMFTVDTEEEEEEMDGTESDCMSLASRILTNVPPSTETDAELEALYTSTPIEVSDTDHSGILPLHACSTNPEDTRCCAESISNDEDGDEDPSTEEIDLEGVLGNVVDIEIYMTKGIYGRAPNVPGLQMGRPDLAVMLTEMREEAIRLNEKRVAVCVCGPKRISYLSRKACIELSDDKVRFDYHEESFG